MSHAVHRAHVIFPPELLARVDRFVSPRKRSKFIAELVTKEVERLELLEKAEAAMGALAEVDIPGWETSESAAEWVRELRRLEHEKLARLERLRDGS